MNSKTILRNTVWYGLENVISFGSSLITSIAIARTLGPSKMAYFIYVMWVANIAGTLGSVGIPATTRKYMAEYLGGGDQATARFVYIRTLWIQIGTATLATLGCVVWVMMSAPAEYRLSALLLVLSIWPMMVNFVSAQANVATEEMSANLPGSVTSTVVFFVTVMLTIMFHWGILGVAAAMLAMRTVDFAVRFVPTYRRLSRWKGSHADLPPDLKARMRTFATQSLMGMLLTLIVWDRSEVFLLKHFSADIRQIAFYSVAFSLADRLLVFPTVFASATGASVNAQYGRDRSRVPSMTAAAARYLALTSLPLHFIATALAGPALLVMYGHKYEGAVAVSMLAPLMCLPKAFLAPVQTLFETLERQTYFIWATIVASVVDVSVAIALIPRHGAVGAVIGSGAAQALCVCTLWFLGIKRYQVRLPWIFIGKVTLISAAACAAAFVVVLHGSPLVGLLGGGLVATIVFLVLAPMLRLFEGEDLSRVKILVDACPKVLATPAQLTYSWLSRRVEISAPQEIL